jgi:hypothetical protein
MGARTPRSSLGFWRGFRASEAAVWHYEYSLGNRRFRYPAATFDECLADVLAVRRVDPHVTAVQVFRGGSMAFGSGQKQYDQLDPVD